MKAEQVLKDNLFQVQLQPLLGKTSTCIVRPRETILARQEAHDGVPMQKGHIQEEGKSVKEEFRNIVQACRAAVTKAQLLFMCASGVMGHKKSFYHVQ